VGHFLFTRAEYEGGDIEHSHFGHATRGESPFSNGGVGFEQFLVAARGAF
jgi:hypothetical protein